MVKINFTKTKLDSAIKRIFKTKGFNIKVVDDSNLIRGVRIRQYFKRATKNNILTDRIDIVYKKGEIRFASVTNTFVKGSKKSFLRELIKELK